MPAIPFPDVPNAPGVPPVPRSITAPVAATPAQAKPSQALANMLGMAVWGIFDKNGSEVLKPDSFLGIQYRQDARVSNYPQEKGAFASYNKVQTPYDCIVRMAIGGDERSRSQFLATCEAMNNGTDLYSVVTPEVSYASATLQNYNYRRDSSGGATMLTVELSFVEIRLTASAVTTINQPQQPASTPAVSAGQVQAAPATPATASAVALPPPVISGGGGSFGGHGASASW